MEMDIGIMGAGREADQLASDEDVVSAAKLAAPVVLELGSDIEMARHLVERLRERCRDHVVSDNGSLYGWTGTRWTPVADDLVRRVAHGFDGAVYGWTAKGEPKQVKLTRSRVDSIIFEAGAMMGAKVGDETRPIVGDETTQQGGWFDEAPTGINTANGFVRIGADGSVDLLPHSPEHRQRHTLTAAWNPERWHDCAQDWYPEPGTMLSNLLAGSFQGDSDAGQKWDLLQEIAGCAVARHGTRLKKGQFVLLYGPQADNGKSQVLDMLQSLFPPHAVASVSVEDWGDEKHRATLQDVAFNAVGELRGTGIVSAHFKAIVSGDQISARDVYRSAVRFRPSALHMAATNKLPSFEGGVDRGVRARLLPIPFNRSIPKDQQVENIGRRIAAEEADLLLGWAVEGARRVIPRGFYEVPSSSKEALHAWTSGADPVLAWLGEAVAIDSEISEISAHSDLLASFRAWAMSEGYAERNLPGPKQFAERLEGQPGVQRARTASKRGFTGLRVVGGTMQTPFGARGGF